ncbi:hypothetical protein C8F04DRAFT_1189528 [Mycena alexandri]|uniref:Uncharacterized protein n=1 Tax=Mycena alexandri TaxID=1745969 RepID=A0AAD6X047_9AGAR|nr:hypothetical protein C8F04DRAFT_1189528 [Mycena alexandri]
MPRIRHPTAICRRCQPAPPATDVETGKTNSARRNNKFLRQGPGSGKFLCQDVVEAEARFELLADIRGGVNHNDGGKKKKVLQSHDGNDASDGGQTYHNRRGYPRRPGGAFPRRRSRISVKRTEFTSAFATSRCSYGNWCKVIHFGLISATKSGSLFSYIFGSLKTIVFSEFCPTFAEAAVDRVIPAVQVCNKGWIAYIPSEYAA